MDGRSEGGAARLPRAAHDSAAFSVMATPAQANTTQEKNHVHVSALPFFPALDGPARYAEPPPGGHCVVRRMSPPHAASLLQVIGA